MIKRTLYFGSPAYLSVKNSQLVIHLPEVVNNETLSASTKREAERLVPIEDIGVVILDHKQITITQTAISQLLDNNSVFICCNPKGMPTGLMLSLDGNVVQSERFRHQIDASLPLKKQLWQQTIQQKIANQAAVLKECRDVEVRNMQKWSTSVRSGDPDNLEARAAVYYWANLFDNFIRDRDGAPPNNLLNYGYAILRAIVARSLVGSGLLPTLGIHHHNRYNAYCLADDIMEPYRPYVDRLVFGLLSEGFDISKLTLQLKSRLLSLPVVDVVINGQKSPLMIAMGQTTASLYRCYSGESRRIIYPII